MAIRIKARHGESVSQMLRRFKKLCEKEGLTKEIKRRQYYEKPSERARRDARRSVTRTIRPLKDGEDKPMRTGPSRTGGPQRGGSARSGPARGGSRSGPPRSGPSRTGPRRPPQY